MDKKIKKSIIAAVTGIMILTMAMLSGCAESSAAGKWYPVVEDPATAMGSIELDNDGTFRTGGLIGEWEESDGRVRTDLMGFRAEYQVGEYEGYPVLYNDRGRVRFCRSAEAAETVYKIATGNY